ncbi:PIN domain-like protein [Favolaschia claudopus]|uniref:PIN domain-like protein n=1 Tax=Favolaschia claudopus TaxID=2862362 RepID=A0AAW0EF93_9AGAR
MGLSGIWKLLHHAVENHNIVQYTTAECFKNGAQDCHPMIIGIDASIWMYQVTTALNYRNTRRGPNPAMQVIYHRLVALLQIAAVFVFVFDGPERWEVKRGTRVNTKGHPLTPMFCELIRLFGFHVHLAPGEADAELGRLSAEGIIHTVQTTDSDVFLFGAQRVMYTPKKKTDGDNIKIYTLENIFISPSIGLTRGGLLLFALLAGGDYDPVRSAFSMCLDHSVICWQGCPSCGAKTAHAIARGSLGDTLLHAASQNPVPGAEFAAFLAGWKQDLCQEFLEDPHGLLGRKYKSISQIIADSDFPNVDVIFSYVHPITSYSSHHTLPPHHTWSPATPNVEGIARFCQLRFNWDAGIIAAKFGKALFPGVALQSLLKPYDFHALLEAHLELGLTTDDDFPRSSVLCVLNTKTMTRHGASLLLYRVEMSAGAVSLRAKEGLTDASAFVTPAAMCVWIPAAIIDYALPGLLSRSTRLAMRKPRSTPKSHTRKSVHKTSAVASSSATTLGMS